MCGEVEEPSVSEVHYQQAAIIMQIYLAVILFSQPERLKGVMRHLRLQPTRNIQDLYSTEHFRELCELIEKLSVSLFLLPAPFFRINVKQMGTDRTCLMMLYHRGKKRAPPGEEAHTGRRSSSFRTSEDSIIYQVYSRRYHSVPLTAHPLSPESL